MTETKLQGLDRGTSTNPFCGPAVLALFMNTPLHEVDKLLELRFGKVQRGLFYPEVLQVLSEQGFNFEPISLGLAWQIGGNSLICWKSHFGVIKNGVYFDNHYPKGSVMIVKMKFERAFRVWKH